MRYDNLICFCVGILFGVLLVRYGIRLGIDLYRSKEDLPPLGKSFPIEQEITGD